MPNLSQIKIKVFSKVATIPHILNPTYYRPLDGLRGVAILVVILVHIGINHYTKQVRFFIDSRFGVNLFFVLSGFLITTLLIKEKLNLDTISLRFFYIRRLLKIVPTAYAFLLVMVVLNEYFGLHMQLPDLLTSLFFLKNLAFKNGSVYTAHFWTLAVEEQFYLTFPLLLSISINKYFYTALSIIIAVPFVSILGHFQIIDTHYLVVKVLMYAFWKGPTMILIGSVYSILIFKGIPFNMKISKYYLTDLILLLTTLFIQNKYFIGYIPYVSELVSAVIMAYVLASVIKNRSLLSIILEHKLLVKTGIMSYSLYIWQQLFIGTRVWQSWLYPFRGLPLFLLMLVKLVMIFVVGLLSWKLIEKKFLKLKARFR